ncbi:hypothetical protein ACIGO9_20555 [Nocardia asteroides]|uniref:hypothetical protein n=1 Tax=Nocardia asteroides TaxID=1824 RepID=UPI0037C626D0
MLYTVVELARCARSAARDAAVVRLAVVDVVAAMLVAPVSEQTAQAVEARDLRRGAV